MKNESTGPIYDHCSIRIISYPDTSMPKNATFVCIIHSISINFDMASFPWQPGAVAL